MNTPWGDIAVSDAHVHFFSHGFLSLLTREPVAFVAAKLGWEAPPVEPEDLAARWVAELDCYGVGRACLIASLPGDESSVVRAVARYPDRFHGFFLVNPAMPEALGHTRKALDSGLRAMALFPAMHRYSLDDPRLEPFYELAAARKGGTIFVHCGVLTVGVRKKLGLPSLFDMRFANPIDLHPIAMHYPRVKFIIPHFGAGYLREALMLADLCGNVYLDTSSTNSWMRYYAPELKLDDVFRRALDVVGPGRLLFGSDSSYFPRGWHAAIFEAQVEALARLGISAAEARRIFSENLEGLFT